MEIESVQNSTAEGNQDEDEDAEDVHEDSSFDVSGSFMQETEIREESIAEDPIDQTVHAVSDNGATTEDSRGQDEAGASCLRLDVGKMDEGLQEGLEGVVGSPSK